MSQVHPSEDAKKEGSKEFDIKFDKDERNWPSAFWRMQVLGHWQIQVTFKSPSAEKSVTHDIRAGTRSGLVSASAGDGDVQSQWSKHDRRPTSGEAATLGFRRTRDSLIEMWFTIRGLFSGRISHKALGGPIRIAETAFFFSQQGVPDLILFLGILSVSLAVLGIFCRSQCSMEDTFYLLVLGRDSRQATQ